MRQRLINGDRSHPGVVNAYPSRVRHCAEILLIHAPLGLARLANFRASMRDEMLVMHDGLGAAPYLSLAAAMRACLRQVAR